MKNGFGSKRSFIAFLASLIILGGCGGTEETQPEYERQAPKVNTSLVQNGTSLTLVKAEGSPIHNLERIEKVVGPYSQPSTIISLDNDAEVAGWAIDSAARKPAGGVDVVIDGKAYKAEYGSDRQDVSDFYKIADYKKCGFSFIIPANSLSKGPHDIYLRVIASNGKTFQQANNMPFIVR